MQIVCAVTIKLALISDTHGLHQRLGVPPCDILIHAGDFSGRGTVEEAAMFLRWFAEQTQAKRRVLIAGNHDVFAQDYAAEFGRMIGCYDINYLKDSGVELDGIKLWGSPFTPTFYDWAFMADRGHKIRKHWDKIPAGLDVLITHGPPHGVLDANDHGEAVGCSDLLECVMKVAPRLHVFGHIHEGRGMSRIGTTDCVNASNVGRYGLKPPVMYDLEAGA